MTVQQKNVRMQASGECLPEILPRFELHHGEALWLMTQLGFRGAASEATFNEYIKSLRKLGTPFERGEIGLARRGLANYSYYHLMELALVLTLRVYHIVPDSILVEIVRHRRALYRHYRRAYAMRSSGIGKPIVFKARDYTAVRMRGLFLDLQINFSGGKLSSFGPPKALAPYQALETFAKRDLAARSLLPINLSFLAEKLVSTWFRAPVIRRGPRPRS
jgi:hypothetical protein